ncbi:hypothetical protein ACN93_21800, partial [Gordonia paraffinivorans]
MPTAAYCRSTRRPLPCSPWRPDDDHSGTDTAPDGFVGCRRLGTAAPHDACPYRSRPGRKLPADATR